LRALLGRVGRGGGAGRAGQQSLEAEPAEHKAWDGYAEFCLFLGREDEYGRARHALLARFGETANPLVAERTALACLLRPAAEDELRQAAALAECAAAGPAQYPGGNVRALFVQGLAEDRQVRPGRAVPAA